MPFITGYGYIPINSVTPTGDFTTDSTPGEESQKISATEPQPVRAGNLSYAFDANGTLELFENDGTPLGFVEIINLPIDFVITSLNVPVLPASWVLIAQDANVGFSFSISNFISSIVGWDGDPATYDSLLTEELYDPFTTSFDVDLSITFPSPGDFAAASFSETTNATVYEAFVGHPTNVLVFAFTGTFDEPGPPPTGPVTNPTINTTTPSVTVIPPVNATIITVVTPTTTITTNATPGTPVTVVLPPSTTVVTITPGPGGTPPSVIIPIDLDVESEGLVIDMAVASGIQLIGNPSGIYTLIPNQRFDVLYERAAGTTTTQTVQIPRPYGITSYVPEAD